MYKQLLALLFLYVIIFSFTQLKGKYLSYTVPYGYIYILVTLQRNGFNLSSMGPSRLVSWFLWRPGVDAGAKKKQADIDQCFPPSILLLFTANFCMKELLTFLFTILLWIFLSRINIISFWNCLNYGIKNILWQSVPWCNWMIVKEKQHFSSWPLDNFIWFISIPLISVGRKMPKLFLK